MSDLSPLLDALERDGYAIIDGLFDRSLAESLRHEAGALHNRGVLQPAGVGGGQARGRREAASRPSLASGPRTRVPDVPLMTSPIGEAARTDHIRWLDAAASGIQQAFLVAMEGLRQAINRRLLLGLFDLECHYACYAPGGYYRPHLDRLQHDDRRTLSAVFYLNDAWTAEDGGALRIYLGDVPGGDYRDVLPHLGTLALFLSDRYWHEVLPARRPRFAVTGWFRTRPKGS